MKKFRDKMKEFAESRCFEMKETSDKWIFIKENLQISLKKSKFESVDARRAEAVLNESYCDLPSAGFFGTSTGHPYCEYKLLPIPNKTLEQKTPKRKNLGRIIQVGNFVVGKSIDTDKEYSGIVQKFGRDRFNNIKTVYILSKSNGKFVKLRPETVRLSSFYPNSKRHLRFDMGKAMMNSLGASIGGTLTNA